MKSTLRRFAPKSTPSSSACKPNSVLSANVNRLVISSLIALGFLAGCATSPKIQDKNLKFFSGKAQVIDKNKNKVEWVYFNSAVRAPSQLRLDVSMGLLGIHLGTLVINGNEATLVSVLEHKVYRTKNGDKLLEKLVKTPLLPADIANVFAENLPLSGAWACSGGAEMQSCRQNDLQLDWEKLPKDERRITIDSPRSKATLMYQAVQSGKDQFEVIVPMGFEVKEL